MQNITLRQMSLADCEMLHEFCCSVYSENFYGHWEEGGLADYLHKVFGRNVLETELSGNEIEYYLAFIDEEPVAFMKINLRSNLPGRDNQDGIELDKIYIRNQLKGRRIGKQLLDLAFTVANNNKKKIFWLSVIDTNHEAISFYEKAGFRRHSKTRLEYPKFKEELKGMWRMYCELDGRDAEITNLPA